ncbi:MAG TPA: hypothetical protein VLF68_04100 [Candidatus Saccharimonadales bacterium]|nr:hypothetical protein [Candidatus Saccharimonadales bacterium]
MKNAREGLLAAGLSIAILGSAACAKKSEPLPRPTPARIDLSTATPSARMEIEANAMESSRQKWVKALEVSAARKTLIDNRLNVAETAMDIEVSHNSFFNDSIQFIRSHGIQIFTAGQLLVNDKSYDAKAIQGRYIGLTEPLFDAPTPLPLMLALIREATFISQKDQGMSDDEALAEAYEVTVRAYQLEGTLLGKKPEGVDQKFLSVVQKYEMLNTDQKTFWEKWKSYVATNPLSPTP